MPLNTLGFETDEENKRPLVIDDIVKDCFGKLSQPMMEF